MKPHRTFAGFAGLSALLSGPIAWASLALVFSAFQWDFAVAFDPARAIAHRPDPAPTLRMGWMLDILGYYLLLVPAMYALHARFAAKAELPSRLIAGAGLGYVLLGALGAAVLAAATVPLFSAYAAGDAVGKSVALGIYSTLNVVVLEGVWNLLSMSLGAIWWLGAGWLLRPERKALSLAFLAIGAASLLDVIGTAAGFAGLAGAGLNVYLWLSPLAAMWLGASLRKL